MTRVLERAVAAVVVAGLCAWASPAAAQAPAGSSGEPIVNLGYVGVNGGAGVVEKFSGVFGGEAGVRVIKNLDVVAEFSMTQDAVTRRQLDRIDVIATYLGTLQANAASGSIKAPTMYGGAGVRWVFESQSRFRPYVLVTFGAAKVELKPTVTLAGTDVTGNLAQYGITLGSDVVGEARHAAATGGVGILMKMGSIYFDGGVRLTSVGDPAQRVNIARVVVGGGYRF